MPPVEVSLNPGIHPHRDFLWGDRTPSRLGTAYRLRRLETTAKGLRKAPLKSQLIRGKCHEKSRSPLRRSG